jgi:tetratricopeptide (TPR) repeat protein
VDGSQWRAWHTLTNYYNEVVLSRQALGNAQKVYSKFPGNYILAMDYARVLLYNGEYQKCLSILDKTIVLPYEGAREGRDIYRQANLLQAVQLVKTGNYRNALRYVENARLWPEHLGVGKPYVTDQRLENYLAAICNEKTENPDRAIALYEDICNYTMSHWTQWGSYHYIGAIVLRKTGKTAWANQLLEEWQQAQPEGDMVVRWSIARFTNDHPGVLAALKQQKKQVRGTPWNPPGDRDFGILLKVLAVLDGQQL